VKSVFDWDMATSATRWSTGHAAALHARKDDPEAIQGAVRLPAGFELPTRAEVAARYAERTGTDVSAYWYLAFARWKTATVYQQLATARCAVRARTPAMPASATPCPCSPQRGGADRRAG